MTSIPVSSSSAQSVTDLVTSLYSGDITRRHDLVSPAGAFQAALYGRSLLIDIRPIAERLVDGQIDAELFPQVVEIDDLHDEVTAAYLASFDYPDVPAHLIGSSQPRTAAVVGALRRLGVAAVPVAGGFLAWRAAGMPVRRCA